MGDLKGSERQLVLDTMPLFQSSRALGLTFGLCSAAALGACSGSEGGSGNSETAIGGLPTNTTSSVTSSVGGGTNSGTSAVSFGGTSSLVSVVASTGGTTTSSSAVAGGMTSTGGSKAVTGGTHAASGGTSAKGGTSSTGGSKATTGGNKATGGTTSTGGSKAVGGTTSTGGNTSSGAAFSQCRFHFGTNDSYLKTNTAMLAQMDYYQPGWMGTNGDTFDQSYVCDYAASNNSLKNLVPVVVSYIAAGYVKRHHNLCDCNVSGCAAGDLCKSGAQYITQDWASILTEYQSFANGYASNCNGLGTTRPIIFKMEPDWYQYTITGQSAPWTFAQAGAKMTELVNVLKAKLPMAHFAIDVSPWVGTSPTAGGNGGDHGAAWFSNFNMSLFTFIATSGGGTNGDSDKIRDSNLMTWSGLNSATKKPILADTGYGANGGSAGHDAEWDVVSNLNGRIASGVVALTQYNPNNNWGTTISGIRSQLSTPKYCP